MWRATILTLFPDLFPGPLDASVLGRARGEGLWALDTVDIRDFSDNPYRSVDDTPAGGGAGLVMRADILGRALDSVALEGRPVIYLTPRGAPLTQGRVKALSEGPGLVAVAGRFEGIDQRLIEARGIEEVSIGDFVLAGGEVAAMALVEACVRLIPKVLGSPSSTEEESFEAGLLEYPQYTRPREFEGLEIPAVLLSGDHRKIADWRRKEAEKTTRTRRPDLWKRFCENGPIRRGDNKDKDR
jgi:tRNA (guanine37-N1)-methyltransferase